MAGEAAPVRVAIVNDYEIVVAGVAAVLKQYRSRVEVVEINADTPVISDVDVVLYDTFGQAQGGAVQMDELVRGSGARVVVFSWNTDPELVEETMARGAAGYVPKSVTADLLVAAIEKIHRGGSVRPDTADTADSTDDAVQGAWPGRKYGLTPRESEVIALITQGMSNREIAERTYLSVNSVKTHVRTAYRKIGVDRRSKAVMWGVRHGFSPDRMRAVEPDTGELVLPS